MARRKGEGGTTAAAAGATRVKALDLRIEQIPVEALKPYERNARTHSAKQVAQIAASIRQFGFTNPVLIDGEDRVIAGHGRLRAARLIEMTEVPTIRLDHLSEAERRAYILADNRLAERAGWDEEILKIELQGLIDLEPEFEIELSGFATAEIDIILDGPAPAKSKADPADKVFELSSGPPVSRVGDLWTLGGHRLLCGDARDPEVYARLMDGDEARMVFTDPPYNVAINGHAGGKGKAVRREFVMASGEMGNAEFERFLIDVLTGMAGVCMDGAIAFVCMDWRHMGEVHRAGLEAFSELKNLIVWSKNNGGMGTFYRSQHELIYAFKKGDAPHLNTFGLGETGRYRTNVWDYAGVNTFGKARDAELAMHPTVKPVAMVADAIRDVSRRGDIVLDGFGGSGTTLIAAEKTRRRARLLELDPAYVDVICRRWQALTNKPAILADTGQTWDEVAQDRVPAAA